MDGLKKKKKRKGSGMKSMRKPCAVSCSSNRSRTPGTQLIHPLCYSGQVFTDPVFWLQHLKSYVRTGITSEKGQLK